MQCFDGAAGGRPRHVDETEPLGAPGSPVGDDRGLVNLAVAAKQTLDVFGGGSKRQVRHVDALPTVGGMTRLRLGAFHRRPGIGLSP